MYVVCEGRNLVRMGRTKGLFDHQWLVYGYGCTSCKDGEDGGSAFKGGNGISLEISWLIFVDV